VSGNITESEWDYGQRVAQTDALGRETRYDYNSFGYISKVTLPDDSTYRYEYDKAGQLIKETDFTSRTLEYAYDPAGQLTYRTQADGHV